MGHLKKRKHRGNSKGSTGISERGRKKAFWLLIILGVATTVNIGFKSGFAIKIKYRENFLCCYKYY